MNQTNQLQPGRRAQPWRATAAAAFLVLAGLAASQAQAAILQLNVNRSHDGTPGFDPVAGAGFDTGAQNGVVRTNDEFQYEVVFNTDGRGDNDVTIVSTLPKGDKEPRNGQPVARWTVVPDQCTGAGSGVSADGQTLTCNLGAVTASGTRSVYFTAMVLGTTPNGTKLPPPATQITSSQTTSPMAPTQQPAELSVSAAPFYDVVVQNSFMGGTRGYGFAEGGGPANEDGFYHRPLVGLVAKHPNGHGRKGVEQLASNIRLELDVSAYPDGVRLDNWHAAATGGFATGCGSPYAGNPVAQSGGPVNMHGLVTDTGAADGRDFVVPNGGTCANAVLQGRTISFELQGVDTSLQRRPLRGSGSANNLIPEQEWWVANKALVLWTPLSSYPAGTPLDHTIQLQSVAATSISGQGITGDDPGNNKETHKLQTLTDGAASKVFTPDGGKPAPYASVRDPGVPGDAHVNQMAHQQVVAARVVYSNRGTTPHNDVYLCEIIDRTAFDIDPATFSVDTYRQATRVRYGSKAGGRYFADTDSASGAYAGGENGTSSYATARCNDPTISWHDSAQAAEAAGGLVYVRAEFGRVAGGSSRFLFTYGMSLRETWAADIDVKSPVASKRLKDQPIDVGTIIRNRADVGSDVYNHTALRDHLEVVPSRTVSRVEKKVLAPANPINLPVNQTVRYQLQPRYSTTFPPRAQTYTVTDVLPPGLSYKLGSATVAGVPTEPIITADAPAAGHTQLVWELPNKTPVLGQDNNAAKIEPIEFEVTIDPTVDDGTTLRNTVAVSGGPYDYEQDCAFDAASGFGDCKKSSAINVSVLTPPGYDLQKRTLTDTIQPGEQFVYRITLTPDTDLVAPEIPDLIDILPFVGDGDDIPANEFTGRNPPSKFDAGAYHLLSVVNGTNSLEAKVFYTKRSPAQIHSDPRDASNAAGGATRWCQPQELGTVAECPASIAEATAVRLVPGIAKLQRAKAYWVDIRMQSHPGVAKSGDEFTNGVSSRSPNGAGKLLIVKEQSDQPVRIGGTGSIAGKVFVDDDRNGSFTAGETGIGDVEITLHGCAAGPDAVVQTPSIDETAALQCQADDLPITKTVNTAPDGSYLLTDLPQGIYRITEAQPANYLDGAREVGSVGGDANQQGVVPSVVTNISLPKATTAVDYNFGELQPSITAVDDNMGEHNYSATNSIVTPSVVADNGSGVDTANGQPAVIGTNVTLTPGTPSNAALTMNATTGVITVAAGTSPGTYTYPYTICLHPATNPAICATATATVVVKDAAEVSLTKEVDKADASVGDEVTFTITVINNGPSAAQAVSVSEQLPSGYTLVSAMPSVGAWNAPTWTVGNLAEAAVETLTVKATVNATGDYANTATVSSTTTPGDDPSNNSDTATVTPKAKADVRLSKTVDKADASVGDEVTFTITVTNDGPSTAQAVTVNEQLPSGYTLVSATPGVGNYTAPTWTVGDLANAASATLTVKATVNATGDYANTATVSSTTTPGDDPSNNSGTATVTAKATVKAVDDDMGTIPSTGGKTPSVVADNNGNGGDKANGLPAVIGTNVTLTPGALPNPPATGGLEMNPDGTITVKPGTPAGTYEYPYEICLLPATTPATCSNAVATVKVNDVKVDLQVSKSVDKLTPNVGETVRFTLEVKNLGPADATGVKVVDQLPSGYEFVAAQSPAYDAATGVWTLGNLANGASASLWIDAKVKPAGEYRNTATVDSDQSDVVQSNNSSSVQPAPVGAPSASPVPVPANAPWALLLMALAVLMLARQGRLGRR